jgi:hypothetical protein
MPFKMVNNINMEAIKIVENLLENLRIHVLTIFLHSSLFVNTYIPLTLYPLSRGISDIPLRCPRFTKITYL